MEVTVGNISGILALLLTVVLIIKGWLESANIRKTGSSILASTMKMYEESINDAVSRADKATDRANTFSDKYDEVLKTSKRQDDRIIRQDDRIRLQDEQIRKQYDQISALDEQIKKRDEQIRILMSDREDLKDWIERLCQQVKSLNHDPVAIRKGNNSGGDC